MGATTKNARQGKNVGGIEVGGKQGVGGRLPLLEGIAGKLGNNYNFWREKHGVYNTVELVARIVSKRYVYGPVAIARPMNFCFRNFRFRRCGCPLPIPSPSFHPHPSILRNLHLPQSRLIYLCPGWIHRPVYLFYRPPFPIK